MNVNIKAGAVAVAASAMLLATPIMADSVGQIGSGNIYRISNLTQKVDFANPAKANACDLLEYKVRIHNAGPDTVNNVTVKATLDNAVETSHSSQVTVSADNANPSSINASASLNLSSAQSISYVPGTTQLLDDNDTFEKNLPDGVIGSGVNIGDVGVSTNQLRYVQFEVKVNCPTPPVTPPTTPSTPSTPTAAPTSLPQTGADEFAGLAGMAGTGVIGYGAVMYRRSKKALAEKLLRK